MKYTAWGTRIALARWYPRTSLVLSSAKMLKLLALPLLAPIALLSRPTSTPVALKRLNYVPFHLQFLDGCSKEKVAGWYNVTSLMTEDANELLAVLSSEDGSAGIAKDDIRARIEFEDGEIYWVDWRYRVEHAGHSYRLSPTNRERLFHLFSAAIPSAPSSSYFEQVDREESRYSSHEIP